MTNRGGPMTGAAAHAASQGLLVIRRGTWVTIAALSEEPWSFTKVLTLYHSVAPVTA